MKKPTRFILFVIFLIVIVLCSCQFLLFYPVSNFADIIRQYILLYPVLNIAFAVLNAVFCLLFLIVLLLTIFMPPRTKFLVLKKDKGRVEISKKTIESTARYSFSDTLSISNCQIRAKLNSKPGKTKVYVKIALSDCSEIVNSTQMIQDKITNALNHSLGITIKSVSVRVIEFDPSKNQIKNATHPRVQ